MLSRPTRSRLLHLEALESRCVLSFIFPVELDEHGDHDEHSDCGEHGEVSAGALRPAQGGASLVSPIRLDLVALHEFGHSLGLDHSKDPSSIMYAYYNPSYNKTNFGSDSAVATLQALYSSEATSPWKNSRDPIPSNTTVDVTYSFIPDGARMDKGTSTTFATFNAIFGTNGWQSIFVGELNRWAANSNGKLTFIEHSDSGAKFNYSGAAQNDASSGDIRIAAHRFDGAGKVLAHAYFPPPNGLTAAGDAHFDQAEYWTLTGAAPLASSSTGGGGGGGASGNLVLADWNSDVGPLVLLATLTTGESTTETTTTVFATTAADWPVAENRALGSVISIAGFVAKLTVSDREDLFDEQDENHLESAEDSDPAWMDALAGEQSSCLLL